MENTALLIFEIIGTVAFAVSGAIIALNKKMDIFGVIILGLVTAVGGGVLRDVILGYTPPNVFRNPIYAIVAAVVSVLLFSSKIRSAIFKQQKVYDFCLLVMDSIGLGIFTVVGIMVAQNRIINNPFFLVFLGVITGVGGGVMRDIMAGNTPYIFVKHFYATASIIGAIVTVILWGYIGATWSMVIGAVLIVVLRLFAAHFRWSLPKPCDVEIKDNE